MDFFSLLSRNFWLIALVVTGLNCWMAERRLRNLEIHEDIGWPERVSLLHRFQLFSAIPWLVMGWGELVGGVPNVWAYFRPQDGDPYVTTWFVCIFLMSLASAYWVLFSGGARRLKD